MKIFNFWLPLGIGILILMAFLGKLFFLLLLGVGLYLLKDQKRTQRIFKAVKHEDLAELFEASFDISFEDIKVKNKPSQAARMTRKNQKSKTKSISFLPMKKFFITKFVPVGVLVIALILVVMDGFVNVPAGHVGVIFDRGRGVLEQEFDEGLHLKTPFWQSVVMMNTRLQTYTMSTHLSEADMVNNTKALQLQSLVGRSESAIRQYAVQSGGTNNSIDALTKDGQRVTVDLTVQFQIDGSNASVIYRSIGLGYVDKVVRPAARSITREKVTGFTSKELYNESTRQKMEQEIEATIKENFVSKNIILGDVLIRHIGFSGAYLNAIEEKQIAQQKIEKAEFEKQEAEIRKEKTIIEAQAEAESIRLKGEALEQSPEVIQLQFVEKMSPQIKWGVLPDNGLPLLDIGKLTQ